MPPDFRGQRLAKCEIPKWPGQHSKSPAYAGLLLSRRQLIDQLPNLYGAFPTVIACVIPRPSNDKFDDPFPSPTLLSSMSMAQHYGVPTRLLDWSQSPLIAAYFAAKDEVDKQMLLQSHR